MVSFALGTDTAGSGRVPAAFNNLVGYKPTLGLLSTRGMVPACRSLDAISIFALTAADAHAVAQVAGGIRRRRIPGRAAAAAHGRRGWSRHATFRFGVPLADAAASSSATPNTRGCSKPAIDRCRAMGGCSVHEVDIEPLLQAARLLYEGPWVAERYLATRSAARIATRMPCTR